MEAYCRRCGFWEQNHAADRGDPTCPRCQAGLWKRKGPSPSPANHFGVLVSAIFSFPGILFMVVYAVLAAMPLPIYGKALVSLLLFMGAVKMAYRAMSTEHGRIAFPSLDPRELAESSLVPVVVFSLVFMLLPAFLLHLALNPDTDRDVMRDRAEYTVPAVRGSHVKVGNPQDSSAEMVEETRDKPTEQHPQPLKKKSLLRRMDKVSWAALLGALALLLYSAMALVLFLRDNSTWSMFRVDVGLNVIGRDVGGYLVLAGMVVALNAVRFFTDLEPLHRSILLSIPVNAVKAVLTLVAYGVCGLYARQKARLLDVPCDDDDWIPMAEGPPSQNTDPEPIRPAPVAPRQKGVAPPGRDPLPSHPAPTPAPEEDEPPLVKGVATVPEAARHATVPMFSLPGGAPVPPLPAQNHGVMNVRGGLQPTDPPVAGSGSTGFAPGGIGQGPPHSMPPPSVNGPWSGHMPPATGAAPAWSGPVPPLQGQPPAFLPPAPGAWTKGTPHPSLNPPTWGNAPPPMSPAPGPWGPRTPPPAPLGTAPAGGPPGPWTGQSVPPPPGSMPYPAQPPRRTPPAPLPHPPVALDGGGWDDTLPPAWSSPPPTTPPRPPQPPPAAPVSVPVASPISPAVAPINPAAGPKRPPR